MQAIKVSFTQNGAYLMEGQNEVNSEAVRRPAIPTLVQNLLCTVGVILGLAWFLFGEYRAGKDMKQATLVAVASLLFGILLVLLFKKIGLLKKLTAIPIPVIETDLSRFEGYHRKLVGQDELAVTWKFDDVGFRLLMPEGTRSSETNYQWSDISRVVARPNGLLIFVRGKKFLSSAYHWWFSRKNFVSEADYQEVIDEIQAKVQKFEKMEAASNSRPTK